MESSTEKPHKKDCLPCRLISGGGVTGAGLYVGAQVAKQASLPAKAIISVFAGGLLCTGTARLLNLPPFSSRGGEKR